MPPQPWTWLVLLLVGGLGMWAGRALGARRDRRRRSAQIARTRTLGARGERKGQRLLRRRGFTITEEQVSGTVNVRVDGKARSFRVRADALAHRRGRTYVVEFKGGPKVGRLAHRDTRRQLLEYAFAFESDGLLLVDAHRGRVVEVEFPAPQLRSMESRHALR